MKAVRIFLTSAAAAGLAASAGAQPPISAMAPPPPLPTGIAPYPPPPYTPTIWDKLGVSKAQREYCRRGLCKTPFGAAMNTIVSPFSKLSCGLIPPFCPATPSLAELQDPGPVGAAAKVKQDRAAAEDRIKAVRYLATVDCHYWPEAEEALINALRNDRNEAVRYEAAVALATGSCCTPKVVVALSNTVGCSTSDGGFMETSAKVRQAAEVALEKCMPCCACGDLPSLDIEGGKKGEKGKGEKPPEDRKSKLPAEDDPNAELKMYYVKAGKLPKAVVLNYAMQAMQISRQYGARMAAPSNAFDLEAAGIPVLSAAGVGRPSNLWDMLAGREQPAATLAYTSRTPVPQTSVKMASNGGSNKPLVTTMTQTTEPPVRQVAAVTPAPKPAQAKPAPKVETPKPVPVLSMMDTTGSTPMPTAPKSKTPTATTPMVSSMTDLPAPIIPRPASKVETLPQGSTKLVSMADTQAPAPPKVVTRVETQPLKPVKAELMTEVKVPVTPKNVTKVETPVPNTPAKLPVSVPSNAVVSTNVESKPVEKKPTAPPAKVVTPIPVEPAGIARVVSKPLPPAEQAPAAYQAAPAVAPAATQTPGMMAEPISIRPAIPARQ